MEMFKHGPGRPRKYGRPSRAVTVTLPDDVLTRLSGIDADLGRAIVSLVEHSRTPVHAPKPAEMTSYGNHAVIVVTPVAALKRIDGVELVPIGNGRALISLEQRHTISEFELELGDALARDGVSQRDKKTLGAIAEILRQTRRSRLGTLAERKIIVFETKRQRRRA